MSYPGRHPQDRGAPLASLILALVLQAGCTVRSLEDTAPTQSVNQCEGSSDCGGGRCVDGQCVAVTGEIEKVLLEVVPPMVAGNQADGGSISSVRYLVERELPTDTSKLPIELRPIVRVLGSVDYSYVEAQGCTPSSVDSVALEVHFTPSEQLLGLAATTYSSTVDLDALKGPVEFSLNVPPGYYDIYLKSALGGVGVACQPTPRLIRRKPIGVPDEGGVPANDPPVGDVHIPFTLAPPATLKVAVRWPQDAEPLTGWTLAMVDTNSGLLLSGQEEIHDYDGEAYTVSNFSYSPVEYATGSGPEVPALTELLRLAPPSGTVAPTLYVTRAGAELLVRNEAEIVFDKLPEVVSVVGQVLLGEDDGMVCSDAPGAEGPESAPEAADGCAVPFSVQIVSTPGTNETSTFNDTIPKGIFATYQTTVETDDNLTFLVDLPVGEYRAIAVPAADDQRPWAIGEDAWILSDADPEVHGKTVSVSPRARVAGRILSAGSGTVSGFSVNWSASPTQLPTTILNVTRRDAPVPRATSASLADNGSFSIFADAGVFNMTVRPEPESGFAWLVKPRITVHPFEGHNAVQELSDLRLPLPVRYHGKVESLVVGGVVPDALIRAYVYLDMDGALTSEAQEAESVIQVGEARADAAGEYQLLLPSELSLSP